eukprot:CAMPEP_0117794450 /NCGR_PEP_ID=MMETSP0948-20121206/10688_1 /TAXON_ID=44440 /ORGANISM="Chattonella subsalsa, Strain CCMP2191" /LENGTH=333 /DNA_ID=CAMNT_0005625153 /DNA_START=206 /DNA_END=1209 /DNA_ORIENTATION=-
MDEEYSIGFVDIEAAGDGSIYQSLPGGNNLVGTERTGRWSSEEHARFLKALMIHGKKWKCISDYVGTRSVVQVRTHAQKHFIKMAKTHTKSCTVDASKSSNVMIHPTKTSTLKVPKRGRPRSILSPDDSERQVCDLISANYLKFETSTLKVPKRGRPRSILSPDDSERQVCDLISANYLKFVRVALKVPKRGRPRSILSPDDSERQVKSRKLSPITLDIADAQKLYDFLTPAISADNQQKHLKNFPASPTSVFSPLDIPSWCGTVSGINTLLEKAEDLDWKTGNNSQSSEAQIQDLHSQEEDYISKLEVQKGILEDFSFIDCFAEEPFSTELA